MPLARTALTCLKPGPPWPIAQNSLVILSSRNVCFLLLQSTLQFLLLKATDAEPLDTWSYMYQHPLAFTTLSWLGYSQRW